jgi:hypothetical protein
MVGSFFRGTIRYGQLPEVPSSAPPAGLSVRQLIEIAGNAEVMRSTFFLKTAAVNHNIVFETQQAKGDGLRDNEYVAEYIHYAIL